MITVFTKVEGNNQNQMNSTDTLAACDLAKD